MRQRVRMSGLISHTTPNGRSYTSKRNQCEMAIEKLKRAVNNGYKVIAAKEIKIDEQNPPKRIKIRFWNNEVIVVYEKWKGANKPGVLIEVID